MGRKVPFGQSAVLAAVAVALAACGGSERAEAPRPPPKMSAIPVAPEAASPAEDGQWSMPAKDYANTRYSGLSEINTGNVAALQVAFTFSAGTLLGQESAPLVVGDTLYFVTPYPNILYAIDLTKPGGAMKWKYDPKPEAAAQGVACCQPVNRGPTYSDGVIFYNTIDAHTVAVDARTGALKWKTRARTLAFSSGPRTTGRSAAARCGDGFPTILTLT